VGDISVLGDEAFVEDVGRRRRNGACSARLGSAGSTALSKTAALVAWCCKGEGSEEREAGNGRKLHDERKLKRDARRPACGVMKNEGSAGGR
jgi:hypothetical protein